MVELPNGYYVEHVQDDVYALYDGQGGCFVGSETDLDHALSVLVGLDPVAVYAALIEAKGDFPTIEEMDCEFGEGTFLKMFGRRAYQRALLREEFDEAA